MLSKQVFGKPVIERAEKAMVTTIHNQNTLYHYANDIKSHCLRMAIAYKSIQVDFVSVQKLLPEEILAVNPYASVPMWMDRDVALYDWRSIFEYIEERYPAPSLYPPIPAARAQIRTLCYRIERDWLTRIAQLDSRESPDFAAITQVIADGLTSLVPYIHKQGFMGSESLTYADCMLAAILWRLPVYAIRLPKAALPLVEYGKRLFEMPFFKQSLTAQERAIYLNPQPQECP